MATGGGAAPPESHQFGNIILGGKDQHREESNGQLKVHPNGFGWKSRKTGSVIAVSKADLRGVEWLKIPHAYQLKLRAKGGFVYKFNGFRQQVSAHPQPGAPSGRATPAQTRSMPGCRTRTRSRST